MPTQYDLTEQAINEMGVLIQVDSRTLRRLWGVIRRHRAKAREINAFRRIDVSTIGALRRR